jgi:pimeloyl-ACP methyl ester carboxylesterase
VTEYEVEDTLAALAYLRGRSDADPRGVGFFGMSKGGGAGLVAASRDATIRCCVTDGAFATVSTLVPYMRYWFGIYHRLSFLQSLMPDWYIARIGRVGLRRLERERRCRYVSLERAVARLGQPLLMIHGEADSYIKVPMARAVFDRARGPKEFWVVPGAKHNGALHAAGDEYHRRVLRFFEACLAEGRFCEASLNGAAAPTTHPLSHPSDQGGRP